MLQGSLGTGDYTELWDIPGHPHCCCSVPHLPGSRAQGEFADLGPCPHRYFWAVGEGSRGQGTWAGWPMSLQGGTLAPNSGVSLLLAFGIEMLWVLGGSRAVVLVGCSLQALQCLLCCILQQVMGSEGFFLSISWY